MKIVTTHAGPKPFSWSYSKKKNFLTCAKRHWHVDIQKDVKEESTEELLWGNQLHEALAMRVGKNIPLPAGMDIYEPLAQRMARLPGQVMVEQKYAINQDFSACTYFDKKTWYRSVADIAAVNGPVAYAGDYKTGKIIEDGGQLTMLGVTMFAHYPSLMAIRTEYLWLKHDAVTRVDIRRSDIPAILAKELPVVKQMQKAQEDNNYPPKPGGLCKKYCPVKQCPHWGE